MMSKNVEYLSNKGVLLREKQKKELGRLRPYDISLQVLYYVFWLVP